MFLYQTTQLRQFIDQINTTTQFYIPQCTGKLILINVKFWTSSAFSNHLACGLAAQVAFVATSSMHSQYNKVLK